MSGAIKSNRSSTKQSSALPLPAGRASSFPADPAPSLRSRHHPCRAGTIPAPRRQRVRENGYRWVVAGLSPAGCFSRPVCMTHTRALPGKVRAAVRSVSVGCCLLTSRLFPFRLELVEQSSSLPQPERGEEKGKLRHQQGRTAGVEQ